MVGRCLWNGFFISMSLRVCLLGRVGKFLSEFFLHRGNGSETGQSRLLIKRNVFFNVFTLPICNRCAIHANVIVVSCRRRHAMRAFCRSVFGF